MNDQLAKWLALEAKKECLQQQVHKAEEVVARAQEALWALHQEIATVCMAQADVGNLLRCRCGKEVFVPDGERAPGDWFYLKYVEYDDWDRAQEVCPPCSWGKYRMLCRAGYRRFDWTSKQKQT